MKFKNGIILFVILLLLSSCSVNRKIEGIGIEREYVTVAQELYNTVLELDTKLFKAFHGRDVEAVSKIFSEELEFFHDKAGLLTYEENMQGLESLMSGETNVTRELVKESMEVYPINRYGAIQIGEHSFYNQIEGGEKKLMGTYRFTHIWKNNKGNWQITKVISYGH